MKKILSFVVAAVVAAIGFNATAQLSYDPICQKYAKNAAKKMAKEMKKGKWEFSGTMTMEDKLMQYYLKTSECGLYEDNAKTTSRAKTVTTGENAAMMALTAEIAQEMFQEVAGAGVSEISTSEEEYAENKMKTIYQGNIAACIERDMSFYRKNLNGTYEVRVLFLINKARKEQLVEKAKREFGGDRWRDIIKDIDEAHGK